MDEKTSYSLKETAAELEIAWQSLRSWRDHFQDYLPMVKEGKQVRFLPEAVEILRWVKQVKEQGLDDQQIITELESRMGQADLETASALPAESVESSITEPEYQLAVEYMKEEIQSLQAEVKYLRGTVSELQIARRDKELMKGIREAGEAGKKKGNLINRMVKLIWS